MQNALNIHNLEMHYDTHNSDLVVDMNIGCSLIAGFCTYKDCVSLLGFIVEYYEWTWT